MANTADPARVIFVSSRLTHRPVAGFRAIKVGADDAVQTIASCVDYTALTHWTEPELVVFHGEGPIRLEEPVQARKFRGERFDETTGTTFTFFVDAVDGSAHHVRDNVAHLDMTGHVVVSPTAKAMGHPIPNDE